MRHCLILLLALLGVLIIQPTPSFGQDEEVVPPEERDTIEAPEEETGGSEKVNPASGKMSQVEEEHTVQPGDTLWDLCAKYLNYPWYWPKVWSYNPEISNPHWIYPGQTVRFYPGGELPSEMLVSSEMEVPESIPEPEETANLIDFAAGKDIIRAKAVTAVTLRRDAFITQEEFADLGYIKGSRDEKNDLSVYDPIYVEFKDASVAQVGQQYTILRTVKEIYHPITGDFYGYFIQIVGAAQVVNVDGNLATAIISFSKIEIARGDKIGPWMPELKKNVVPKPNNMELKGYILDSQFDVAFVGENHVVFIDQGTDQGVEEGNVFDVIRREDGLLGLGEQRDVETWDEGLPVEIFGRIMIVDARPRASTGLVMASLRELQIGDRVLMTKQ